MSGYRPVPNADRGDASEAEEARIDGHSDDEGNANRGEESGEDEVPRDGHSDAGIANPVNASEAEGDTSMYSGNANRGEEAGEDEVPRDEHSDEGNANPGNASETEEDNSFVYSNNPNRGDASEEDEARRDEDSGDSGLSGVSQQPTEPENRSESTLAPAQTPETSHKASEAAAAERGWKPASMSAPVLVSFAAFSLLAAACIEMLARRSGEHGGLALSPGADEIPQAARIAQKYVPIVVATVYSMVWNWIDQDVKRMQPWFELSRPQGGTGEDSLLLSYSHDFFAVVLFKAAKKKHWPVLLSGTMMTVILFIITPLQASIMAIRPTVKLEPINVTYGSESNVSYPGGYLSQAFNIKKYQQPFPPFTTPDYALLPFFVDRSDGPKGTDANITARTIKVWTELACWQPRMEYPASKTRYVSIPRGGAKDRGAPFVVPAPPLLAGGNRSLHIYDDGKCELHISFALTDKKPHGLYYIGDVQMMHDWVPRHSGSCFPSDGLGNSALVALVWSRLMLGHDTAGPGPGAPSRDEPKLEITPRVCRREYYRQEVEVTVAAHDYKLDESSLNPVSERLPLNSHDFRTSKFEDNTQVITTVTSNTADRTVEALAEALPQSIEAVDLGPASVLVKFFFLGQNVSVSKLADPEILVHEFNELRNLLFSVYSNDLMVNNNHLVKKLPNNAATASSRRSAILVSRPFSALVEGLLVVKAVGCLMLYWLCRKSPCRLESNPNCILRLCHLCRNDNATVRLFEELEVADMKTLTSALNEKRFRLSYDGASLQKQLYIEIMGTCDDEKPADDRRCDGFGCDVRDPRPFELTRKAGVIFFMLLVTATIVLVTVKIIEVSQGGLPPPTDRFEASQILEKWLPSGFGTALGAIWVILNKQSCVLEPFRQLCAGKASPERSIATTYLAIPPQLTVWRAVKARHYVLAVLCLTCLLAQLLNISLGTLFNESTTVKAYAQRFEPIVAPSFSNQSVFDFHRANKGRVPIHDTYLLYSDMTSTTPLPPWTTRDYLFQSHRLGEGSQVPANTSYIVTTRGFGVRANCTTLSDQPVPPKTEKSSECTSAMDLLAEEMNIRPPGNGTMHCARAFISPSPLNDTGACAFDFVAGWARTEGTCASWKVLRSLTKDKASTRASAVYCRPFLETGMFDVAVDARGKVYSYNQTRDSGRKSNLNYSGFEMHTRVLLRYAISFPDPGDMVSNTLDNNGWHTEVTAGSWMSMMLAILRGSRDFLDPGKPPPPAAELVPSIEEIYRRGFAIFLGRHSELFDAAQAGEYSSGEKLITETRIFLGQTSLIISLVVMSINMVVAIFIYARPPVRVLPRMPTCIASTMAYVAPSRLVAGSGETLDEQTLSFGRYVGLDGKAHTGIELDDHVTSIEPPPHESAVKGALRWRKRPSRGDHQSLEEHQSPDEP